MTNKRFIITLSLALLALVVVGSASSYYYFKQKKPVSVPEQKKEIDALTFYNWWTSPGESVAINALINVFIEKYPNTAVMPTSVIGGGGYSMLGIIKPLVSAGSAPDSFQMHAAYEGMPYYSAGLLDPIDDIWESEQLEKVIPSVVQDMNKFDGHYYSVPVNIHRVNLIWYNQSVLDKNKIDPESLTTWDEFFTACKKLRNSGIDYPIQLGESWTAAHVFEQIIASQGIDFYQDWVNGKILSADNPELLEALEIFKTYLSYANIDHEELTWNDAVARVIKGKGAFSLMGDWANQEFKLLELDYGSDYGVMAVPGTGDIYGLCIDTFQRPKNIIHPTNADRWLKIVSSQEGQDAFNPLKGSISARTDADITKYDDYQRSAIADFWKARYMFPSVVHGSGAPEAFKVELGKIISDFITDLNINKTAIELTEYTAQISDKYTIKWSLK